MRLHYRNRSLDKHGKSVGLSFACGWGGVGGGRGVGGGGGGGGGGGARAWSCAGLLQEGCCRRNRPRWPRKVNSRRNSRSHRAPRTVGPEDSRWAIPRLAAFAATSTTISRAGSIARSTFCRCASMLGFESLQNRAITLQVSSSSIEFKRQFSVRGGVVHGAIGR